MKKTGMQFIDIEEKPHWYILMDIYEKIYDWAYITNTEADRYSQKALDASEGQMYWLRARESQSVPREAIEDLKKYWLTNPFWDLEEMEGFESARKELYYYRLAVERQWELEAWRKATLIPYDEREYFDRTYPTAAKAMIAVGRYQESIYQRQLTAHWHKLVYPKWKEFDISVIQHERALHHDYNRY